MGQFQVFLAQFSGKQKFSQTSLLCQFELLINHQLHVKYQKNLMKLNEAILRKIQKYVKSGNFGAFRSISGTMRIFSKEWTDGRTNGVKIIGLSQSVSPINSVKM